MTAIKKTRITIDITYPSDQKPEEWDWVDLLEVDEAKVVSAEEICAPQDTVEMVCQSFMTKENDNSCEKDVAVFISECCEDDHRTAAEMCDEFIAAAGRIKRKLLREADKHGGARYSTPSNGDETFNTYDDAVVYLNGEVDDGGMSHMIVIHEDGK